MGKTALTSPILIGSCISIGGKEVEVESVISIDEFMTRNAFLKSTTTADVPKIHEFSSQKTNSPILEVIKTLEEESMNVLNAAAPKSLATHFPWKNPLLKDTVTPAKTDKIPTPRHNPTAPQAIVMRRPKEVPKGKQLVDVVVDPLLTQHLREHQREGVKFMYECVMGMRDFDGKGAILADEMGLGKTLQTIALLWTMLKQNPIYGDSPLIKKALIVCPVTLINNWRKEFRKWLGTERIGVFVCDGTKTRLSDFTRGKSYSIMIIGYEKLRTVQDELKKGSGVDIVVADEGHRLKTAKNKSAQAIRSLNTSRRIILSGTPIQNDLSEFFMMVDFINPGLLGSYKAFTKEFELPIEKSRQPDASTKDLEKGKTRNEELASLTSKFILRRSADILSRYLPSKTEYVLLCRPTPTQISVYQSVLACPAFQAALGNTEASFQLITVLKKVCNSPSLLIRKASSVDSAQLLGPITASLLASVPAHLLRNNAASTKIRALDQLLHNLQTTTSEKIVLVSNYTSTLDLLGALLTSLSYPFLRLDGSTPSSKRQDLVDSFNHSPADTCFAFLLSAKSGGVGLNLIGASRLVLFDADWNPATDLQAMARIHRDGQKRDCIIYRFMMAGGIDEKIWQRQTTKLGLASNIMEQKGGSNSFTKEELRDLFRLDESLSCQTHDLLCCNCGGRGLSPPLSGYNDASSAYVQFLNSDQEEKEDDEFPEVGILVQANKIDMKNQERKIKRSAHNPPAKGVGSGMESIMAYTHIDTSRFSTEDNECMEALIKDEILLNVLKDEGNTIGFVFAKNSF